MHVERARITEIAVTPYAVEQLLARRDASGAFDEMHEQREFLARQFHILVAAIDAHVAEIDRDAVVLVSFNGRFARPSKNGTNARDDFLHGKGFDDVIVGADV